MFQVVLSNKDHMEYGVVTVPFPIPEDQYTDITRMLEVLHIGSELSPDCMVESVESDWPVLRLLTGQEINLDELDYLAKRLDGISPYEKTQFQAAAERYGLSQVTDLINLTFCCDQATVIVDFSDLEQVGRIHYLTLNGGATREEMESLDGYETALLLINEHPGIITPYGVFYDIDDGILNPKSPDFEEQYWALRRMRAQFRVNHYSWWKEEMPSEAEYNQARSALDHVGWEVDYVITHCAPSSIVDQISNGAYRHDLLTDFLEEIRVKGKFRYWLFGHYHDNRVLDDRYILLWEQIVQVL